MRNRLLLLSVLSILLLSTACEKGELDPAMSLRSRTQRLQGKWKLESATLSRMNSSSRYLRQYANGRLSVNWMPSGYYYQGNGITWLEFDKDGNCRISEVYQMDQQYPDTLDPGLFNSVGSWQWMLKTADTRRKESLVLNGLFTSPGTGKVWNLIRLSYTELRISQLSVETRDEAGLPQNTEVREEWIFTRKN